jgi:hypothetical protein
MWDVLACYVIIAGNRHPVSGLSVRYRSIPVPKWVPLFQYWTGSGVGIFFLYGTGLTGCRTVRHSSILKKIYIHPECPHCKQGGRRYTLHVHAADVGGGERYIHCTSKLPSGKKYTLHINRRLLMVLFLAYKMLKNHINAEMPECQKKVSPASGISSDSKLLQSDIVIAASGLSPVALVTN